MEYDRLSKSYVIVRLHRMNRGLGWVYDKEAARKQAREAGAKEEDVHNTKRRFSREAVQEIADAMSDIYDFHNHMAIATAEKGDRRLPISRLDEYRAGMDERVEKIRVAKEKFMPHYPEWVREARERLGKLFKEEDYPSPEQMSKNFAATYTINPIPSPNTKWGLPKELEALIIQSARDEADRMMSGGLIEIYGRLIESVGRMVKRLQKSDGIFRDTLVKNIRDICDDIALFFPSNGNTELERLRAVIEEKLANVNPDDLRENRKIRTDTLRAAEGILKEVEKAQRKIVI